MNRKPRFEIVRVDGGWITRLRGRNGKVVMSSASQLYTKRSHAIRAITIAVEAVGYSTEVLNGTIVTRPSVVDERTSR